MNAHWHDDSISRWAYQLKEKSGWQKAVVALALEDWFFIESTVNFHSHQQNPALQID